VKVWETANLPTLRMPINIFNIKGLFFTVKW
jgi:hypothetical protein